MLQNTRRTRGALGAAAVSTFCVALAVVVGVVPRAETTTSVRTASADPTGAAALVPTAPAAEGDSPVALPEATTTTPSTAPAPGPSPAASSTTVAPPPPEALAAAPEPEPEPEGTAPAAVAPGPTPPPPSPVTPAPVPRRQPSSAEVQQAIDGLAPFVRTIFTPTHAQVNDLGNKVCTAFDQGQTVDQVKATGLEMVSKVPFTTVLPGAADYVVRTAVTLYCPGHAPKLG